MIDSTNDPELEKIQRKKIAEMLQHAKSAETATGKPIILSDSNFFSQVAKYSLLVVDFLGSMVWSMPNGWPFD